MNILRLQEYKNIGKIIIKDARKLFRLKKLKKRNK